MFMVKTAKLGVSNYCYEWPGYMVDQESWIEITFTINWRIIYSIWRECLKRKYLLKLFQFICLNLKCQKTVEADSTVTEILTFLSFAVDKRTQSLILNDQWVLDIVIQFCCFSNSSCFYCIQTWRLEYKNIAIL